MPDPIISSMVIPVKNASTGEVSTQTFDLPAGGSSYTIDSTPTENSTHLVTSGGVYDFLETQLAAVLSTAY